jgi:hypothetical protein
MIDPTGIGVADVRRSGFGSIPKNCSPSSSRFRRSALRGIGALHPARRARSWLQIHQCRAAGQINRH